MAAVGKLALLLSANTGDFSSKMKRARKDIQGFGDRVRSIGRAMLSFKGAVIGAIGAFAGFHALRATLGFGVKLAAELEQAQVAFTTMLGSAEAARAVLEDLNRFAASTPFQLPDLTDASKKLLAFGVEVENLLPTLRAIGDVSAGIGAPIGEIAEIFGKARVQGRLMAQDINQLTGRGIPVIQQFAKQFGVAESAIRKMVEQGKVNFPNLQQAFIDMTAAGGQFAGLMAAQSQTLSGLWSTLKDNAGLLARAVGEGMMPALKEAINFGLAELPSLTRLANDLGASIGVIVTRLIGAAKSSNIAGMSLLNATRQAAMGFAHVADMIDAVMVQVRFIESVASAVGGFVIKVILRIGETLGELINLIPGVSVKFNEFGRTMDRVANSLLKNAGEAWTQTKQLFNSLADPRADIIAEKFDGMADSLRNVGEEMESQVQQIKLYGDLMNTAAESAAAAGKMAQKQAKAATKLVESLRTPLEEARAEWKEAVELFDQGLISDETLRRLHKKLSDVLDDMKELKKAAEKVFEETRTPFEKFKSQLAELQVLLTRGLIDENTFARAVRKLQKELLDDTPKAFQDKDKSAPSLQAFGAASMRQRSRLGFDAASLRRGAPEKETADNTKKLTELGRNILRETQEIVRQGRDGIDERDI